MALKSATTRRARKSSKSVSGQQSLPVAQAAPAVDPFAALGITPEQLEAVRAALAGGALPAPQAPPVASGPVVEVSTYKPQKGASYPALQIWFNEKRISKKSGKAYGADVFLKADSFRKLLDILDDQADAILEQFESLEADQAE